MTALCGTTGEFSHRALFYQDEASYLAGTVPFVCDGLDRGEPVAVAVPQPNLVCLRGALGSAADHVTLIDMGSAGRNPGRIIPSVLRAFADSHDRRVRIIGEPIWAGRSDTEYPACVQHEALINASFVDRSAIILCPYDVTRLPSAAIADAEVTHPLLVDALGQRTSPRYAPDEAFDRHNVPLAVPAEAASMTFDLGSLSKARQFATEIAEEAGLTGEKLHDVALVVGELCANSVQHGGGGGVLTVWPDGDGITCEVADKGQPSDRLLGRRPATVYQDGGRGLLLVNQIADLVRTHVGPDGMAMQASLRR